MQKVLYEQLDHKLDILLAASTQWKRRCWFVHRDQNIMNCVTFCKVNVRVLKQRLLSNVTLFFAAWNFRAQLFTAWIYFIVWIYFMSIIFFHGVINFTVTWFYFHSVFTLIERNFTEIPIILIYFTLVVGEINLIVKFS